MKTRRTLSKRAGVSLPISLLFFLLTIGVVIGALELSNTTHRVAVQAHDKSQANVLATSGVYAMYDAVWRRVRLDGTYPLSLSPVTVTNTISGSAVSAGTYSASVEDAKLTTTDLGGGSTRYDYSFVVKGLGVGPRGQRTATVGSFTGSLVKSQTSSTTVSAFPGGAVQSNTTIAITAPKGLQSEDSYTGKGADFVANKGLTIASTSGGSCSGDSGGRQEKIEIQGKVFCANTPTTEYLTSSKAAFGPLASAGKFTTVSDSSCGARSNDVTGAPLRSYPGTTQVDQWLVGWKTTASGPGCRTSLATTETSWLAGAASAKQITAPAIIRGNLTVSAGNTLQVVPSSTSPSENVLLVEGDILNLGSLINYGCTVVCTGTYRDLAASKYEVKSRSGGYTFSQSLNHSSLVSTSTAVDAIRMKSNKNSTLGFVYAAKGGLVYEGENECRGALLSGGPVGGVTIKAGSEQKFHIHYEPDCLANKTGFGVKTTSGPSTVTTPFLPSKLFAWRSGFE